MKNDGNVRLCQARERLYLVVFHLAFSPIEIPAQDIPAGFKPLEVNIHAGMLFLGDPQISDRADPATGARVMYHFPSGFGFGGNFDWARQGGDRRLGIPPTRLFFVQDILFYSGEIGYTLGRGGRIEYFLGGGLGGATIRQIEKEPGMTIRSDTFVLVPFGGGLRVLNRSSDPTFAFRIDLRDHIVWIGEPEGRQVFLRHEGAIDNVELSAGISFFFEGP